MTKNFRIRLSYSVHILHTKMILLIFSSSHKFAIHPPSRLKFQLLQVLKNHPNQFVLSKVPRSEDDAIEVEVSSFKAVEDLKNSLQKSEIQFEITKNEVHQPKEVQPSILKNFPRYKEVSLVCHFEFIPYSIGVKKNIKISVLPDFTVVLE